MFDDFNNFDELDNEQYEQQLEPEIESIHQLLDIPEDLSPYDRALIVSESIGELPAELQMEAIAYVVEDAELIKDSENLTTIIRNIIKTGLGEDLEQWLKDDIEDLAYAIEDDALFETMVKELEDAGIITEPVGQANEAIVQSVEKPKKKKSTSKEIIEEEQEIVSESFSFSDAVVPENWDLGGDAHLTGNNEIDPEGDGWLRLTENKKQELGYALYDKEIETQDGLKIEFDYASWGKQPGLGFTVFLVDGQVDADNLEIGAKGNALGFAPKGKHQEGMKDAVVGVAFDFAGIFSKATRNKPGGPGKTPDSVSVRSGGDGTEGYEYLGGTERLKEDLDDGKSAERPDQESESARYVAMTFTPKDELLSVKVDMKFGADSEMETVLSDVEIPGEIPDTVKVGFVSATGGRKNITEIDNVVVTESLPEEDIVVAAAKDLPNEKVIVEASEKTENLTNKSNEDQQISTDASVSQEPQPADSDKTQPVADDLD